MSALLELSGVGKRYSMGQGGEVHALHSIDFEIREGEFVAIMGPSGSGKTTLLEILGAISRPSEGTYTLDGVGIQELSDDALADLRAQRIGFVFQTYNLMPRMSALRNAGLPLLYAGVRRAEREQRARRMLERMDLGHRLEHRPAQLSGGERQRVAIARALVNEPAVLLADEPTGNLDLATGHEILEVFRGLHQDGRTLIIVTHSEEVAAFAERIVRLRDGQLAWEAAVA